MGPFTWRTARFAWLIALALAAWLLVNLGLEITLRALRMPPLCGAFVVLDSGKTWALGALASTLLLSRRPIRGAAGPHWTTGLPGIGLAAAVPVVADLGLMALIGLPPGGSAHAANRDGYPTALSSLVTGEDPGRPARRRHRR
jgi:hypothetical protein